MWILIDGDSIAYKAAYTNSIPEMMQSINNKMWQILQDCGHSNYELYLEEWREDKDLFRSGMTLETKSYKGNRKGPKPELLNDAREYMKSTYNAKVIKHYESEDLVLIRAYEIGIDNCIIAYIDKDLLQYPLTFYNYNKRTIVTLTEDEADLNLWKQVLTGDMVDNIPGLRGWGPVRSQRLLSDKYGERKELVVKTYKELDKPYEYFIEQYNLIRLRNKRFEGTLRPVTQLEYKDI